MPISGSPGSYYIQVKTMSTGLCTDIKIMTRYDPPLPTGFTQTIGDKKLNSIP